MKKVDLANRVSEKLNLPPENAMEMLEAVVSIIKHAVQLGETVKIPLFGNFVVRQKRARIGRNPKTGQEAEITARRVVTFRPSLAFRRQVDDARMDGAGVTTETDALSAVPSLET